MVAVSATRSCRQRSASMPNGRFVRLTTKPATSAHSITRLPIASPSARIRATASGADCIAGITSTRRITGGGLKKCIPTTREGSGAAPAIAVIGIDDVLDARTASGASAPSRPKSSCLSSSRSGIASTITSQPARSVSSGAWSGGAKVAPLRSQRAGDPRDGRADVGDRVEQQRLPARLRAELRDAGTHRPGADDPEAAGHAIALIPVSALPMISRWICDVPS